MKDFEDDAIDRVLGGLRTAEPHAGLEQRVRLGLERRRAESLLPKQRIEGLWTRRIGVALAVVVAVTIAGVAVHNPRHRRVPAAAAPLAERAPQIVARQMPKPTPQIEANPARLRRHERQVASTVQIHPREDAAATEVSASFLPSFPAPEAPLTEQERLLMSIARHPDPTDLALLNPEKREELAAVDAKEFQRFFNPPPPEEKKQ